MPDLNIITEALVDNDFTEDLTASPGYESVEYVKNHRDGSQDVVIVDFKNSTVTKERYNAKGSQTSSETVDAAIPSRMNQALQLARG